MRHSLAVVLASAMPAFAAAAFAVCGCAITPSIGAKAQETAQEMNMNARFGRMEVAVESVAPKERQTWSESHRGWGGSIRIADTELAGVKVIKGKEDEADVIVKIAWYRPEENELRTTTLEQRFKDVNGDMKLVGEKRLDGDLGLLGERIVIPHSLDEPARPTQFQTIHIGGTDNGAVYRAGE